MYNVHIDDIDISLELSTGRRYLRANERKWFDGYCISSKVRKHESDSFGAPLNRKLYNSADDTSFRGDSVSNMGAISKSSFGSYCHSVDSRHDRINFASFKKNFAASCLPSSMWNHSLPNISFSFSYPAHKLAVREFPLHHSSSVEYFTPQRNFTPTYGAYCTWSSSGDDLSEGKKRSFPRTLSVALTGGVTLILLDTNKNVKYLSNFVTQIVIG